MHAIPIWLGTAAAVAVVFVLAGWLGVVTGRKAARRFPAMAGALWILSTFLKIDPPPPPKAERVTRNEDDAGVPPKV